MEGERNAKVGRELPKLQASAYVCGSGGAGTELGPAGSRWDLHETTDFAGRGEAAVFPLQQGDKDQQLGPDV
jgi:hypothetical protein